MKREMKREMKHEMKREMKHEMHVLFQVKFGNMEFCNFSTNNPQNSCLVSFQISSFEEA